MKVQDCKTKVGSQTISYQLAIPDTEKLKGNLVIIFAHGSNTKNGMDAPVVKNLFELLCRRGFCTVRFNFPFAEKKKKTVDDKKKLMNAYKTVVKEIKKHDPSTIILAGYSLGSIITTLVAKQTKANGLLLLGLPLNHKNHKQISIKVDTKVPILCCSGTEDKYTNPRELTWFVSDLKSNNQQVELFFVNGVNHGFTIPDSSFISQREIYMDLVEMIDRWIGHHWY